ncbi:MAG: hypothetical protein KAT14_07830 [Candidatus Marinimicrobia bacterium]|nr:hypothetical protein [Candidatus Neomarinimicrobiota bacterium]
MTGHKQKKLLNNHIEAVKEIIQSEFEMLKSETERPFDEKELMKKAVGINRIQYINFIEELSGEKWEDLA